MLKSVQVLFFVLICFFCRASISVSDTVLCAQDQVSFHTNLNFGLIPVEWEWDFGNGQKAFVKNPRTLITYTDTGVYMVIRKATGYYFAIDEVKVEENYKPSDLGLSTNRPDFFLRFPNIGYTIKQNVQNNNNTPTFTFFGALETLLSIRDTLELQLWEDDSVDGSVSIEDENYTSQCGGGVFSPCSLNDPGALIPLSLGEHSWSLNGNSGQIKVTRSDSVRFVQIDTILIRVLPRPSIRILSSLGNPFCQNERNILSTSMQGIKYTWFKNNKRINAVSMSTFTPTSSGVYSVEVETEQGCTVLSDTIRIDIDTLPSSIQIIEEQTRLHITTLIDSNLFEIQWFKEGVPILGATSDTLSVGASGKYQLRLRNKQNSACVLFSNALDVLALSIKEGIGIDEEQVRIYPIPNQGHFKVDFTTDVPEKIRIEVIDMWGRVHYRQYMESTRSSQIQEVRLSHRPAKGLYFVKIIAPDETFLIKKMLID